MNYSTKYPQSSVACLERLLGEVEHHLQERDSASAKKTLVMARGVLNRVGSSMDKLRDITEEYRDNQNYQLEHGATKWDRESAVKEKTRAQEALDHAAGPGID